jgi:hypothetical protein
MATLSSPTATTAGVTAIPNGWWLKDPLNPAANVFVGPDGSSIKTSQPDKAGTFDILGKQRPIVVSDGPGGESLQSLTLLTYTPADYTALKAITNAARVLLVQSPFGEQWYVWILKRDRDLSPSTPVAPWRHTTLDVVEVDAP